MRAMTSAARTLGLIVAAVALAGATLTPSAGAAAQPKVDVKFEQLQGFIEPTWPALTDGVEYPSPRPVIFHTCLGPPAGHSLRSPVSVE